MASGPAGAENKADAHVWRESNLPTVAAGTTVIGDVAYLGTGLITQHHRRAGRPVAWGRRGTTPDTDGSVPASSTPSPG
ncbi:hypothetical protein Slala05_13650 [Streptomyces lavendulae subsp. lavendulae]|nr:hypothetical protein Slala05_13650 [Streptomyces lavendulae subsp. lavendulae]